MPPIKPKDVIKEKVSKTIPEFVFDAFNDTIVKYMNSSGIATFKQKEVEDLILKKGKEKGWDIANSDVYSQCWLDVEDCYRQVGWVVIYDKPGFNENYPATFTFKKRPTRSA